MYNILINYNIYFGAMTTRVLKRKFCITCAVRKYQFNDFCCKMEYI